MQIHIVLTFQDGTAAVEGAFVSKARAQQEAKSDRGIVQTVELNEEKDEEAETVEEAAPAETEEKVEEEVEQSTDKTGDPVAYRVVVKPERGMTFDGEASAEFVNAFADRHPGAEIADHGETTSGLYYIDVILYTDQEAVADEIRNDGEIELVDMERYPDGILSGEVEPGDVGMEG